MLTLKTLTLKLGTAQFVYFLYLYVSSNVNKEGINWKDENSVVKERKTKLVSTEKSDSVTSTKISFKLLLSSKGCDMKKSWKWRTFLVKLFCELKTWKYNKLLVHRKMLTTILFGRTIKNVKCYKSSFIYQLTNKKTHKGRINLSLEIS